MTTTYKNLVAPKYLENTQTAQYTNTATKAIIDSCTVTNISSDNVDLNVNIVKNSFSVADSNKFISDRTLQPDESYLCPELIGVVLESGDFISTLSSASDSLTFILSGREIS